MWVKEQISQQLKAQWLDNSRVEPEHKYIGGVFYVNSEAGLLVYKPKEDEGVAKFRDDIVNKFEVLLDEKSKHKTEAMFNLYKSARKKYKVRWKANFRTRCRSLIYNAV